jgi:hypothetical protein
MCVLRVRGKDFDADRYLALSGLEATKVFHRGEPRFASRPDGPRSEASGFNIVVSDASWDSVRAQVEDAIAFLEANAEAVRMLRSAPGVDDVRLDFPLDLRIDRVHIMAQFDYLPPKLVSLAGALGLGLEISIYPSDLEDLARGASEGEK